MRIIVCETEEPMNTKSFRSVDYAYEHYCNLLEKYDSTEDLQKKIILFRRLINLLAVMEFLINMQTPFNS